MTKTLRVVLSVVVGFVLGSVVNMGFIMLGGKVIAPPDGADVTTMAGLQASLHLFEPRHFLFPFLAHAGGTFAGSFVATLLAAERSPVPSCVVGVLFLLGGTANVFMLPGPAWFNVADLLLAYGPTAWLGYVLAARGVRRSPSGT